VPENDIVDFAVAQLSDTCWEAAGGKPRRSARGRTREEAIMSLMTKIKLEAR